MRLSPSDGLLMMSAALHLAAAVFYASVYRASLRDEHRAFARFASAFAAYVLGSALLGAGESLEVRVGAALLLWTAGSIAVSGLVEFASALGGGPAERRTYPLLLGWSVVTIAASIVVTGGVETVIDPRPTWPANVLVLGQGIVTFAILGHAIAKLARLARERTELRRIVRAIAAAVGLGFVDELVRWRTGVRFHLAEHGGIITVAACTLALAERQMGAVGELSQKSKDLTETGERLATAKRRRGRRQSLAALGELSAVVAHEVRNPLAIIKNAVSSLRRPMLAPADRATLLAIVGEEASRLSRLVRDLLAFARPRAAAEVDVDLRALVHRAVRDATKGEAEALARIEVDMDDVTSVQGDPELLRLALANVVENALQSGDASAKVSITARAQPYGDGPGVDLTVTDTGSGMTPEVRHKARDPFFTTRPTGTGLGLAIVERVLKSHAGELEIESGAGAGCTVRLRLPAQASRRLTPLAGIEAPS